MNVLLAIGFLLVALAGAIAIGFVRTAMVHFRNRKRLVVQTLASIVARNLPLPAALRAAAAGERGGLRRTYLELARRLEFGDDLAEALHGAGVGIPGDVLGALQGAERGGTAPAVLQALVWQDRRKRDSVDNNPAAVIWYGVLLMTVMLPVGLLVAVRIAPLITNVFQDFDMRLPTITVQVVGITRVLADNAPLFVFLAVAVFLVAVQVVIGRLFLTRVPGRGQLLFSLGDTLVWWCPGLRQAAVYRGLARQLAVLQAAIENGHDLSEAAQQAAYVATNVHVQQRMVDWARALERGSAPVEAAVGCRIAEPVRTAIRRGGSPRELGARLAYLADYYQRLVTHWEDILSKTLIPVLILIVGLAVGYFVLGIFMPIIALIEAVANSVL